MKLTSKSEYALLALVHLARHGQKEFCPADEIAGVQKIPGTFLEQILLSLKRAGFLESQRGSSGGYRLARQPGEISLADILRNLEGPIAASASVSKYFYRSTPLEKEKSLCRVFKKIRDSVSDILESTTLADLLR